MEATNDGFPNYSLRRSIEVNEPLMVIFPASESEVGGYYVDQDGCMSRNPPRRVFMDTQTVPIPNVRKVDDYNDGDTNWERPDYLVKYFGTDRCVQDELVEYDADSDDELFIKGLNNCKWDADYKKNKDEINIDLFESYMDFFEKLYYFGGGPSCPLPVKSVLQKSLTSLRCAICDKVDTCIPWLRCGKCKVFVHTSCWNESLFYFQRGGGIMRNDLGLGSQKKLRPELGCKGGSRWNLGPENGVSDVVDGDFQWTCFLCFNSDRSSDLVCGICNFGGGLIKPLEEAWALDSLKAEVDCPNGSSGVETAGKEFWFHCVCARAFPNYFEVLKMSGKFRRQYPQVLDEAVRDYCFLCFGFRGLLVTCDKYKCGRRFHPYCAYNYGLYINRSVGRHKSWLFYCRLHSIVSKPREYFEYVPVLRSLDAEDRHVLLKVLSDADRRLERNESLVVYPKSFVFDRITTLNWPSIVDEKLGVPDGDGHFSIFRADAGSVHDFACLKSELARGRVVSGDTKFGDTCRRLRSARGSMKVGYRGGRSDRAEVGIDRVDIDGVDANHSRPRRSRDTENNVDVSGVPGCGSKGRYGVRPRFLSICEDFAVYIFNYWIVKRKAMGRELIPRICLLSSDERRMAELMDPVTEMQMEYQKIVRVRQHLERFRILVDICKRREILKKQGIEELRAVKLFSTNEASRAAGRRRRTIGQRKGMMVLKNESF